jgi:hypothetical protein
MCAAIIPSGCERGLCVSNALERLAGILQSRNSGRIASWTHEYEVIVHHVTPVDSVALRHEPVLARTIMNEQGIRVAFFTENERLTSAYGNDADVDAGLLSKERDEMPEETGLLRRRRRCERDEAVLRASRGSHEQSESEKSTATHGTTSAHYHMESAYSA